MSFNDISRCLSGFFTSIHDFISIIDWTAVIIVFSVFLITIMGVGVGEVIYKDSRLSKHFGDKIFFKGYIRNEFYNGVRKYTLHHYDKYDDDFVDKEILIYDYFDSLIFDRVDESFCYLNKSFCEYIESHHPEYKLSDFSEAIIKYRRFCELQSRQQLEKEQMLENDRLYSIKCSMHDSRMEFHKKLSSQIETSSDDFQGAYMQSVNRLKQNGFEGLMPIGSTDDQYMMSNLKDAVILPHDKLQMFLDGKDSDFLAVNVAGILICYDTYSEKYYIDSADHVLSRLSCYFQFDPDDAAEYDDLFRADVYAGHKLLVKLLPLSVTGYTDINVLRNDLVDLYDCSYPRGYNLRKYVT